MLNNEQSVQVSDTTEDDSSNAVDAIKKLYTFFRSAKCNTKMFIIKYLQPDNNWPPGF